MATSTDIDFGGLDLVCNNVKIGATAPGKAGTTLSGTELTYLDSVTAGTAAASKAVVLDSNLDVAGINVAGIARIDLDSATATLSSHAATITKWSAVITTEALTTAAGASQAFAITKTGVAAGDIAVVNRVGGTSTAGIPLLRTVCTSNTVTVTVDNAHASAALNGTLIFNLVIFKA